MPEKAIGHEPVDIVTDNSSLFRAASRVIYQREIFWPLLKIGSLAKAITESDYHINEVLLRYCDYEVFYYQIKR